jgi:amino acid transporter/mannitol/fructose-specific phosphotransferase system IIA component (Ntr-type)
MPDNKPKRLKKELKLLDVYAIATGTTLSAGFFLLPGLAARQAGNSLPLAYLLAVVPLIPATFSIVELATAMPRAGGVYYFLDRTMGPLVGTVGGVGTWLALIFKVAFALIGMGAYLNLFFPSFQILPLAITLAIFLGAISFFGSKSSGRIQVILVMLLLGLLSFFMISGIPEISLSSFNGLFESDFSSLLSTAGLVYISYVGITKIASLSEEIKNPEKNIPLGIFLSLGTTVIIYFVGTMIMVNVIPMNELIGNLTPVATAANSLLGRVSMILLSIAAIISFISVANAGIMSASRYPLAMGRDHILPKIFRKLNHWGAPVISLILTVSVIVLIISFLNPIKIAKLASAFQLLMFGLVCLAVIIIRESRIDSYDPGFKSPFYPWMQITGIIIPLIFIAEMGWLSILFSSGLVITGIGWYFYYAKKRVVRTGAIYHIFERLGRQRFGGLESEMRGILKEKGLRDSDPFDEIVTRSNVIDLKERAEFDDVVETASAWISQFVQHTAEEIKKQFLEGTRMGATPVTHGIALPHLRLAGLQQAEMVLVRANNGVHMKFKNPLTDFDEEEQDVKAIFFLVSPEKDPTQHLRILAQIAGRVDEESFEEEWKSAKDDQEIKEALIHEDRCLSLVVDREAHTSLLLNKQLKEIKFPEDCLVAMVRRSGQTIIPKGNTVLMEGDRLTIIGNPKGMAELKKQFPESS